MALTVATCQFPTSASIDANANHIAALLREAKTGGAQLAHFCEGAISGYAGHDFSSTASMDWTLLERRTRELFKLVGELRMWLVVGSAHRLTPPNLPHNSVYVVDQTGRLVDRYDKRFCAGKAVGDGELANFTPGDHYTDFEVEGVLATVHVCHEYRYPELVRTAKQRGVQLVLHSFHAAAMAGASLAAVRAQVPEENRAMSGGATLPEITMPASMTAAAASSHVWISCPNSSTPESAFGSFAVRPDGVVIGQLERHATGTLLSEVDPALALYDSTAAWRARAMSGRLHSGELKHDLRSQDRRSL